MQIALKISIDICQLEEKIEEFIHYDIPVEVKYLLMSHKTFKVLREDNKDKFCSRDGQNYYVGRDDLIIRVVFCDDFKFGTVDIV